MADMTIIIEWVNQKIDYLNTINNESEKREELQLIEIKLKSLSTTELNNVASNTDISRLFSHITSTSGDDRESFELICNILTVLFDVLNPSEIYQKYLMELTYHISHHNSAIKKFVLFQFNRMAAVKHPQLLNNIELLNLIIEKIGDDDIGVAEIAMKIIKESGKELNTVKLLYSGVLLRTIAKMVAKNDSISFRVYDVIVDISKSSEECLQASINSGLIDSLINITENDDILLQLNALDALGDLAVSNAGLSYLEQREFLSDLNKKISRASEDPLSNLLIPGLMKFFGNITKNHPHEMFTKYPTIIYALCRIIEVADDMVILMNALDTLGHVASTVDGKYALDNLCGTMPSAMKRINIFISEMPTEVRIRALECLALILHLDENNNNNRILELIKSWFDGMTDDPLLLIVNLCKQPFPDIRLSAMKVLLKIASQYWGQEYIANHPGLVEFLTNRRTETNNDCKFVKYDIVKALSKADCFDARTMKHLLAYVHAGPLAIEIETEVATESGGNT